MFNSDQFWIKWLFFTSLRNFATPSNKNNSQKCNLRAGSHTDSSVRTLEQGLGMCLKAALRGNYPSVSGCLAKTCPAPPAELSHNLNDLSPPWPWPATGSGTRRGIDRSRARGRGHRPRYSVSAPAFTTVTDHTSHCKCPLTFGYILHLFSY